MLFLCLLLLSISFAQSDKDKDHRLVAGELPPVFLNLHQFSAQKMNQKITCFQKAVKSIKPESGVTFTFYPREEPVPEWGYVWASCPLCCSLVGPFVASCSKKGWTPGKLGYCIPVPVTTTTPAPTADSHILLIGGLDASARSSMERFYPSDPTKSCAVTKSLFNDRRQLVTGMLKDGSIIIAGGWSHGPQGMSPSNTAEIFFPTSESSMKAPAMAERRAFAGGAVLNGTFHVCGGVNGSNLLSTCELYQSSKWVPGISMTGLRSGLAMAAAHGHIYAIGGCADRFCSSLLATAERSAGGAWAAVASMQSPRVRHAAAALGQFIYVCGGRGKNGQNLSSCERYDTQSGQWSQSVSEMAEARSDFSLASFNGRLVAMGGTGASASSTAEIFDPEKNEWKALQHLIHPRSGASAVTV